MIYPFNTKQTYLSDVQQQHFESFRAVEPKIGYIYTNSDGESRKVNNVLYPLGVVTEGSVYTLPLSNGSRNYHTPIAKAPNGLSQVQWVDEEGNMHVSTSQEWMEWIDSGTKAKQKVTGTLLDMKEIVKAMTNVKMAEAKTPEEKEAISKFERKKAEKLKVKRRVGRPKTKTD